MITLPRLAASRPFAAARLISLVAALLEERRQIRHLLALEDRLLDDVGLDRDSVMKGTLWDAPLHWQG